MHSFLCRFILCDRHDVYEESIDSFDEEALEEAKERERERKKQLSKQVDFQKWVHKFCVQNRANQGTISQ